MILLAKLYSNVTKNQNHLVWGISPVQTNKYGVPSHSKFYHKRIKHEENAVQRE